MSGFQWMLRMLREAIGHPSQFIGNSTVQIQNVLQKIRVA